MSELELSCGAAKGIEWKFGWFPDHANVQCDALDVSPEKFVNVNLVEVSDDDGPLSRSVTEKENNANMKERIWINRVASEIVFQPCHPDTGTSLHDEHVIAVVRSPICILYSTARCHRWNAVTLDISSSPALTEFSGGDQGYAVTREHGAAFCWEGETTRRIVR